MSADPQQDQENLSRALKDKEEQVQHLRAQVQHLKAHVQGVQARCEGDVQQAVSSLQEQYNAALELMQLGFGLGSHGAPAGAPSGDGNAGVWRSTSGPPASTRLSQPAQQAGVGASCKCSRGAGVSGPAACCCKRSCKARGFAADPRASVLGLNPDDISPAAAYGAAVGLNLEPVALLRDVLNLDGTHDRERERLLKPLATGGIATGVAGPGGPMLAQAQFEARLRGAYRSMLMQLQHRYMLERERQEEMHKLQLQDQAERHSRELRERTSAQEAQLAQAAKRLEQEAAARRLDLKRLEGQLMELKVALEASQEQAGAARATTESLKAQLELQRSTHEAELQHIMQGSISLQQHEEVVRRLKVEWEAALQQRERDYASLLAELTGLRRQLSSAGPSSASEGSSSYNGPAAPAPAAATGQNQPPTHRQPLPAQRQLTQAVASGHGPQAAMWRTEAAGQQQLPQQGHRDTGGLSGGGNKPGSPGGQSVALSLDEMGASVLEVSEDTMAPTPQSRAAWVHEQDMQRPPSAASSRLSELVDAVMGSGRDQQRAYGGGPVDGVGAVPADDHAAVAGGADAGSPDRASSELTLGGWQGAKGDGRRGASPPRLGPRPSTAAGQQRPTAGQALPGAQSPRADVRAGEAAPGAAGRQAGRAMSPRSPTPGPAAAPGAKPSQWAGSGNPAAAVNSPKCLRCGLNDITSPGCCRFHPALLSQPGSLMFTPEWMACQAAGHTTRTAGCLIRTEHFYAPLLAQPTAARAGQAGLTGASTGAAGGAGGVSAAARKPGAAAVPAVQPARVPPRSRSPRAGSGSSPDPSPPRAAAVRVAAAAAARPAGAANAGSRASGQRGGTGGGMGGDGGEEAPRGGDGTPSPRPRTRLPSPLRR